MAPTMEEDSAEERCNTPEGVLDSYKGCVNFLRASGNLNQIKLG